ncbi:MAG: hypothetical protein ACI8QZ_002176 [Chlamydiales bacterium]|jgi:hypothetical protein
MKNLSCLLLALLALPLACKTATVKIDSELEFAISFPTDVHAAPLTGRVLLMVSKRGGKEPRFQISDGAQTQQIFGIDVHGLAPGEEAIIDGSVFGYPLESLGEIASGEYTVQALLHRYETFHRSDGHTVDLPMDRGEGQHWNRAPGNLYSTPLSVQLQGGRVRISLANVIPPIEKPEDTKYIKYVELESELLTEFWGRPMKLGACVLLPEGFDAHPHARYPLVINHGHFPSSFGGFREEPPDADLEPEYSERFQLEGYNIIQQQAAHDLYKRWTGPDHPRMIIIEVQHANPYYDDSYAVNSENLGPYGDAIMHELVPFIEERFHGIGEGWARFTYGGSTGGWEALAVQILYPDEFNGCFAACPDPVDFRAYTVVDIYNDENAYHQTEDWKRTPRPGHRDTLGHVSSTLEQMNRRELVLGTHSRSGDQWDIWEAVYSPVGADGYPQRIWDKRTGVIDKAVAAHWRENYDLRHILERDWATLGPKLQGKLNIYCGTMDNYYLNNAVYLMQDFLERTEDPPYGGLVDYGDRAEHCWNGDHTRSNALSRLRYHVMYVDQMMDRISKTAPQGADLTSWRY